jgi:hypothetical protein
MKSNIVKSIVFENVINFPDVHYDDEPFTLTINNSGPATGGANIELFSSHVNEFMSINHKKKNKYYLCCDNNYNEITNEFTKDKNSTTHQSGGKYMYDDKHNVNNILVTNKRQMYYLV